jgi:hypothetical protein
MPWAGLSLAVSPFDRLIVTGARPVAAIFNDLGALSSARCTMRE